MQIWLGLLNLFGKQVIWPVCTMHFSAKHPVVSEALQSMANAEQSRVVVVPWLLTDEEDLQSLNADIELAKRRYCLDIAFAAPSLAHASLINVLVANHVAAQDVGALSETIEPSGTLRPVTNDAGPEKVLPTMLTSQDAFELRELERRIDALLPSQYKGRYENVRPESMGSAELKYDDEGKVAWDQIWTSFCDLALAGGPPHRGTLLEAVTTADVIAEPEQYKAVVEEIKRGIQMITGLPMVLSSTPGWVGVRCNNIEMAVWLMRAIIVENIMVRREGEVLYLPAGPRFTIKREIKNVITAVAKTTHYWSAHLRARQQAAEHLDLP